MIDEIMKIVIKVKPEPKVEKIGVGSMTFGTVFSGTINKVKGIFLVASGGIFRLDGDKDDNPYPFGNIVFGYNDEPKVSNFKIMKATLTIETE